jgi:hypothetical protein
MSTFTLSRVSVLVSRSASGDPLYFINFDLGGYEGAVRFESLSATKTLIEDSIDLAVSRALRLYVADAAVDLINDGFDHVLIDVMRNRQGDIFADITASDYLLHPVSTETVFENSL